MPQDVILELRDPIPHPRRDFELSKKEYDLFVDAIQALDKANERFDGTCDRNDQIMVGLAMVFAKKIKGKGPEKLKPKNDDEPLQVVVVEIRKNVEVYWVYMKLGDTCDKVQITDSKTTDFYEAYNPPSWFSTN
jgi:hypothetical protein